jgi:hypothetical protein
VFDLEKMFPLTQKRTMQSMQCKKTGTDRGAVKKNQEPDGWMELGELGAHTLKKPDGAGDMGLAREKTE